MERTGRYAEVYLRQRRTVRRFDPDVVCSQLQAALLGARVAGAVDASHLVFLRDESTFTDPSFGVDPVSALEWASGRVERALLGHTFDRTDRVVANSEYTARRFRDYWDVEPAVIFPFIDTRATQVDERGEKILHVNPSRHKGIDITTEVARQMPAEEFLVVGEPTPDSEDLAAEAREEPNVEFRGWVEDMSEVYRETKLVLMPSRVETFGRVPVEAGISGIPTVGAPTGGLPEAIGIPELVAPENRPEALVERIRLAQENYDEYAVRAREHASEMDVSVQCERLERLLCAL